MNSVFILEHYALLLLVLLLFLFLNSKNCDSLPAVERLMALETLTVGWINCNYFGYAGI